MYILIKNRDGVGWGGDDDVYCTCTHVRCYTTDGNDDVSCTCTHVRCYATDGVGMMTYHGHAANTKKQLTVSL